MMVKKMNKYHMGRVATFYYLLIRTIKKNMAKEDFNSNGGDSIMPRGFLSFLIQDFKVYPGNLLN
jgi:hypothetical protein